MTEVTDVAAIPPSTAPRGSSASGRKTLSRSAFRADIEGLRAVAVLAVVLYHAGVPGLGGGFVGVDVFFVVSGFLITGLLWREVAGTGGIGLGAFYAARARRLLPAAALVLTATAVASAALLPALQARAVLGDAIASALYVGNYRFAIEGTDYLASDVPPSPVQHYWSLGVEEQFYLLWPALMIVTAWLVARAGWAAARSVRPYVAVLTAVAAGSFALSLVWTHEWPSWAFFSLPTRAWELAAGGLVALTVGLWRAIPPVAAAAVGWGGLALIVLTCTQVGTTTPFPGTAALLPVLGTVLVIGAGCATPDLGVGRFLGKQVLRGIGRVSYSWYLWHWPVLVLAPAVSGQMPGLAGRLALVVISLGLAILTLHLVENPARFAVRLRTSAFRSLLVGVVATGLVVCAALVLLSVRPVPAGTGTPARQVVVEMPGRSAAPRELTPREQVQAAVVASVDQRAVPANLSPQLDAIVKPEAFVNGCVLSWADVQPPECASGDVASPVGVALVGDSHAAMWQPGVEQIARERHWRLTTLSKVTCPVMDLPIRSPYLGRDFTECVQWRDAAMARLERERPQVVVVDMSRRYGADFGFAAYDPVWLASMTRTVSRLRATGAQVLVLGPVPDPQGNVPTCLSGNLDDAAGCAPGRSTALNDNGIGAEAAAVAAGGGSYAALSDLFCTAERCPVVIGDTLVYRDDNHITAEYAAVLGPLMAGMVEHFLG